MTLLPRMLTHGRVYNPLNLYHAITRFISVGIIYTSFFCYAMLGGNSVFRFFNDMFLVTLSCNECDRRHLKYFSWGAFLSNSILLLNKDYDYLLLINIIGILFNQLITYLSISWHFRNYPHTDINSYPPLPPINTFLWTAFQSLIFPVLTIFPLISLGGIKFIAALLEFTCGMLQFVQNKN